LPRPDAIEAAADHYRNGNHDEAARCCREIIECDPEHFEALHLLGVLRLAQSRHQAAVHYLERAAAERPDVALVHFHLGNALAGLGRIEEAIGAFRRTVRLAERPDALNNLGNALRQLQRHDEAIESYRRALAIDPDNLSVLYNFGKALAEVGRTGEAVDKFRQALSSAGAEVEPARVADIYLNLSDALVKLGRDDEALAACQAMRARVLPHLTRPRMSAPQPAPPGDRGDRERRLIRDRFGANAEIHVLRDAPALGGRIFIVDFERDARRYRTLGSLDPDRTDLLAGESELVEQSSMDLLSPGRLVLHCERVMAVSFALCRRPLKALLLGVGGAAMWRFLRAYVPECAATLVDYDAAVAEIARRWFHLDQPVVLADAQRFLDETTDRFDVILADLCDASAGAVDRSPAFWGRCLDVLSPGGCIATNWPDFVTNQRVKLMAESLSEAAQAQGLGGFYATQSGFRSNLVQFISPVISPADGPGRDTVRRAHERFARERGLPDGGRDTLQNCMISARFPIDDY
jgi:tetratricopeptide (TPR) repeat protein